MKVLYIAASSECDGSTLCLLNMLDALAGRVQAFVILPKKGYLTDELQKRQIQHCIIPMFFGIYPPSKNWKKLMLSSFRLMGYIFFNLLATVKIISIAKKYGTDIIHSNNGVIRCGFYAAKFLNIPHVWHLREYQDLGLKFRIFPCKLFFLRLLNSAGNHVICITQGIAKHFRIDSASVIYDGVRSKSEICDSHVTEKDDYILFVGTLTEQKGFTDLLHVWNKFCKKNNHTVLKVAGKAVAEEYKAVYEDYIRKNNLENRILLLGVRHDIDDLMRQAKALVVPSYFEAFGRITAEAMLNYCLVIGRDSAGTAEILKKEHLGKLFNTPDEFLKILHWVCNVSCKDYNAMIKNARNAAEKHYLTEQNAENIYNFYRKILNS